LKRKLLLAILAVIPAAFMPLAATSQIVHTGGAASAEQDEHTYKYEIFAGYGYTSLNQVYQSRNGLQGVNLAVTRDLGKHFGLTADGGYYAYAYDATNPGKPTVEMVLFGPVVRANLYKNYDVFFRGLLGGAHTGGESATPNISFAGGVGGGVDYRFSPHFTLRASGDDIASSFLANASTTVCSAGEDCSAHRRLNSRAALGLVYKF
jgi:hypothetical protein